MREITLAVLAVIERSHLQIGPVSASGLGLILLAVVLFYAPALVWHPGAMMPSTDLGDRGVR